MYNFKPIRWSFLLRRRYLIIIPFYYAKTNLISCEAYVEEYNIHFNSPKSQLIDSFHIQKNIKRDILIEMKNGSKIKMVDKCKYMYSDVKLKHTPDVVRDGLVL